MYRVHVGYTRSGRDRWIKFDTLEKANAFCNEVMFATGTVLTVIFKE